MIVNSERTIALRCPACQALQQHEFSLFSLVRKPLQILCPCGFSQGHLRKAKGRFELDVLSIDGDRLRLVLPKSELLRSSLVNLVSPKNGRKLGLLGGPLAVEEAILAGHEDFSPKIDGFSNPAVMQAVLELLQNLAEQRRIRCECEHSSVGIDVYADQVELVCSFCGSTVQIEACTQEHQERLSRVTEIVMEPCTRHYLGEWLKTWS